MQLDGQSIVITGAGGGLGAAYARAAAAIGANVVVNDISHDAAQNVVGEIMAAGGVAVAQAGDICDAAVAETLVARCISEFGSITGLVNNAGVFFTASFEDSTLDRLRLMLEVNVIGSFNCAKAAVAPMLAQGFGSIVNITSGAHSGMPEHSSYGASKGAISSLTFGMAVDLGSRGIRVNAVSPLAFTPMAAHLPHLPLPEVNVPPVLYLLSDRSKAVNGQIIRITGQKLSLMTHPANRTPVVEQDVWTLDSVADAFDETLAALQFPLGVATYEIGKITL